MTTGNEATQIIYIKPPSYLMEPCGVSGERDITTNQDMLLYILELRYNLNVCALKVDGIRNYLESQ